MSENMYNKINPLSFVLNHSAHQFTREDRKNYKERDRNFIQCLQAMGISVNTVKYHKKNIFIRTGTHNTAEAIQWMNN